MRAIDTRPWTRSRYSAALGALVCLLMGGRCSTSPAGPGGSEPEPAWGVVLSELPGGLLSVSGRSAGEVYAVGTDPGDGLGPLVRRYEGQAWTRL